jgi:hypothetical protein
MALVCDDCGRKATWVVDIYIYTADETPEEGEGPIVHYCDAHYTLRAPELANALGVTLDRLPTDPGGAHDDEEE